MKTNYLITIQSKTALTQAEKERIKEFIEVGVTELFTIGYIGIVDAEFTNQYDENKYQQGKDRQDAHVKKLHKLSERTKILILEGARITGAMEEAYHYAYERLYVGEEFILEFCQWIDKNVGGCSERNIGRLFECWQNPTEENNLFVKELSEKIKRYK